MFEGARSLPTSSRSPAAGKTSSMQSPRDKQLASLCGHVSIGFVLLGWIHPLLKLEIRVKEILP